MRAIYLFFTFCISLNLSAQIDLQQRIHDTPDGGTVIFPAGDHIIETPLSIAERNGLTIMGEPGCKILLTDVWSDVILVNNSTSIRLEGLYVSHLKPLKEYECNGGVISLNGSKKVIIDNCELEGSGTIGVRGANISDLTVSNCYVHDNTFNAFYFHGATDVLIHSSVIENNANLIQSYDLDGFEMSDNIIRENGGYWRPKNTQIGLKK